MGVKELILLFTPAVIGSFAFTTSFLNGFWCQSLKFSPLDNNTLPVLRVGPWYREITTLEQETVGSETYTFVRQGCADYPSGVNIDSKWKTTRAFTVLAPLLGGLMCLVLWFAPCRLVSDESWKKLAMFSIVILTLFQGLTFLLLESSLCDADALLQENASLYSGCQWDDGSTTNVVSVVLWFLTGVAMIKIGAPQKPNRPPPETQEVTYQRTVNPDGTTTVAEVQVIKGTAVPETTKGEEH